VTSFPWQETSRNMAMAYGPFLQVCKHCQSATYSTAVMVDPGDNTFIWTISKRSMSICFIGSKHVQSGSISVADAAEIRSLQQGIHD